VQVQQMRMVGHLRQKSLDIPEATPIVQEKISTGIAGLFWPGSHTVLVPNVSVPVTH